MAQYEPSYPLGVTDVNALAEWLHGELLEISKAISGIEQVLLPNMHRPPAKVAPGMLVRADGVDWDPGAGRGIYWWDEDNGTWNKL